MSRLSDLLERLADQAETLTVLDRPADAVQKLTGALPPGQVKDLLSGTPIGHPLHPLLVTLPIGAFSWAAVLDLTGGDERAARRLVGLGVLAALPTAAAGASDWSDTSGAERRVGLLHAGVNTAGLALLAASWLARRRPGRGKLLALGGLGLIGASGWLGGHLSYAMGVGVDTTAFVSPPEEWTDACAEADLSDGRPHRVLIGDFAVLLVRDGEQVHAIADRCTHRGAPLDEGTIVDGCIECPWHGSRFRLVDGAVERGPATRPQAALEVRVAGGQVQVRRPEPKSLRSDPV